MKVGMFDFRFVLFFFKNGGGLNEVVEFLWVLKLVGCGILLNLDCGVLLVVILIFCFLIIEEGLCKFGVFFGKGGKLFFCFNFVCEFFVLFCVNGLKIFGELVILLFGLWILVLSEVNGFMLFWCCLFFSLFIWLFSFVMILVIVLILWLVDFLKCWKWVVKCLMILFICWMDCWFFFRFFVWWFSFVSVFLIVKSLLIMYVLECFIWLVMFFIFFV